MTEKINAKRLFYLSCVALITTAMTFAIRARLEPVWSESFALTDVQIAWAFGTAFWGFTIAQFIGGPLVDLLGMKRLIWIAFALHLIGIILTLFASGFWTLFLGCLFIGVGNGSIEAACNPLVASIFPNFKTKMLNRFHVWFPGGIVIGGLTSYFVMDKLNAGWQWLMASMFIPLIIYGIMMLKQNFPVTERVKSGVSYTGMWKAILKPLFLIMLFCMLLTAAIELTTTQRISVLLEGTGTSAILILVFINGIMAVGRLFAGPIVDRLKSTGVLLFSAVFSFIGLILMSYTNNTMLFVSAAVFAVGICFFWPTMLGFISERIPDSGALGLSIFGGAGMLSVSIFLPISGWLTDNGATGSDIFRYTAILPVVLLIVFIFVFSSLKRKEAK